MIKNEYDGPPPEFSFNEFFAGCGLAWTGLGPTWDCRLANDFDWTKKLAYELNHDFHHFKFGNIAKLAADDVPEVNCWWASPPCQDVSLAGAGAGLGGARSGAFWPFVDLVRAMGARAPNLVVIENVEGLVSGRDSADFVTVLETLMTLGYRVGATIIDASFFVPQSRGVHRRCAQGNRRSCFADRRRSNRMVHDADPGASRWGHIVGVQG
jgi:DNA (cytosine-5)-methyltransferase 1